MKSRRQVLKFIGIGTFSTVTSIFFNKFLHHNPSTLASTPNTSTIDLEKLLLETGKEHLPRSLYEATLLEIDH